MKKNFNFLGLGNKVFSYPIEIEKKHCILINEENKRFLVDTGSPTSVAYDEFTFCGNRHHAHGTILLNSVRELSGLQIDGLIGLDLMKKAGGNVLIDYPNREIRFSSRSFDIQGCSTRLHTMLGMAVCFDAEYEGRTTRCLLDTGAQISYINGHLVENLKPSGQAADFHPLMGNFEVSLYDNIDFKVEDIDIPMTCGVLPPGSSLDVTTSMITEAILGYDLLKDHQVSIDFNNKLFTVGR